MNVGPLNQEVLDVQFRAMDDWKKDLNADEDSETQLPGLENALSHAHSTTIRSFKHELHTATMLHIDDEDIAAISPSTAVDSPTFPGPNKWTGPRDKWLQEPHQIHVRSRKISEGSTAVSSLESPNELEVNPISPLRDNDERDAPSSPETPIKMPPPTPPHITVGFQLPAAAADEDEEDTSTGTVRPSGNANAAKKNRMVRFNSRVRITSGIHCHQPTISGSSSASSSSSISAPLRPSVRGSETPAQSPPTTDISPHARSRARKPPSLDQILNPNAVSAWLVQKNMASRRGRGKESHLDKQRFDTENVDETTPILAAAKRRRDLRRPGARPGGVISGNYVLANGGIPRGNRPVECAPDDEDQTGMDNDEDSNEDGEDERGRGRSRRPIWQNDSKTEEDVLYGKWPARAINPMWWWWKLGNICCCSTPLESDYY